jgi:hypothetical protein
MTDVPEIPKDTTLEPILHERERPTIDDKPVEVPADSDVDGTLTKEHKATMGDKIALPARSSLLWTGVRHFMYGGIAGGSAAWMAIAGVFKLLGYTGMAAIGASIAPPFGYIVVGCAAAIGLCDAFRKVAKEKSGGKDWTDVVYLILEFVVKIITAKKLKGVK